MRLARLTFFATLLVAAAIDAARATYCRAPPRPVNGGHSAESQNSFRVGTVVKYWCGRGYRLLGSKYNRCAASGASVYWDRSAPLCIYSGLFPDKDIDEHTDTDQDHQTGTCPDLRAPTNGGVHAIGNTPGSYAKYFCGHGYVLWGNKYRKCLNDGSWSGSVPTCKATECPELTNPENGKVKLTDRTVGSQAWYICKTGYRLVGSESRTCQDNLQWTPEAPTCKPIATRCKILSGITFGYVTLTGTAVGSVATYSCLSTHRLVGEARRVCQPGGYWSGGEPTCKVFDCEPLEAPEGGKVELSFSGTALGSFAKYTCNKGYMRFGSRYRKCVITGWTGEPPICKPVDCGPLDSPGNGEVKLTGTTFNSTALYRCNQGYVLVGKSTRVCQANREWSGEPPTCKRTVVSCDDLTDPANGKVDVSGRTPGSTATYACNTGYTLVGVNVRTCGNDGVWSDEEPMCKFVVCGNLANPTNGRVRLTGTTFGSIATYSCNSGYRLIGEKTRECLGDGRWSRTAPTCEREAQRCDTLPQPENGQVEQTGTTLGSTATYTCFPGYRLKGESIRTCAETGWSGKEPTCEPVECEPLSAPVFGEVFLSGTILMSTATYRCSPGYLLLGVATRECQATGFWSGQAPTCEPVDCGGLSDPDNGRAIVTSTVFRSTARYLCDAGFTLFGVSERVCQQDGTWSDVPPSCTPTVDCGPLADPRNGMVMLMGTTQGSKAMYTCKFGFMLVGEMSRICQSNGQWSGEAPTCKSTDCLPLADPTNGRVEAPDLSISSTAIYTCDSGYELEGQATRTCQMDRTWSGQAPTCTIVDCGSLVPPVNGFIDVSTTTFGSRVFYSCDDEFILQGNSERICLATGKWSGSAPTCGLEPMCQDLSRPSNGDVTLSGRTPGSTADYSCNQGYILVGNSQRTCESNGQWSGRMPTCKPVDCGPLSAPENGQISIINTTLGSPAVYRCNIGYRLSGAERRVCTVTGEWSNTAPECIRITCPRLTDPSNGRVTVPSQVFASVATYDCNDGFVLVGERTRTCANNGQWSGEEPRCEEPKPGCSQLPAPENGRRLGNNFTVGAVVFFRCFDDFDLMGSKYRVCQDNGEWSGTQPVCQPFNDTCPVDKAEIFDRCGRRCQCVNNRLVNCCRVRKDYAALDTTYRQAYINAFLTVARDNPIYQARYNDLVALYMRSFTNNLTQITSSSTSQFFMFNRYYLLEYEDLLKDIDCRLTIPYYDWTPFPDTPYSAAVWNNDDGFGDTARFTDGCIITGPLEVDEFRITPSAGGGCLVREFRNQRFPSRDIVDRDLLPLPAEEFKDFHRMLQLFIGLNVQCFIGGTMCSSDAANDPVYLLHLSKLDFLLNRWQGLGAGRQSVRYTGDTSPLALAPGFTVEEFYTNRDLPYGICVQYDPPVHLKNHGPPPALLSTQNAPAVLTAMDCASHEDMDFVPMSDDDHQFMKEQCNKQRVFRTVSIPS